MGKRFKAPSTNSRRRGIGGDFNDGLKGQGGYIIQEQSFDDSQGSFGGIPGNRRNKCCTKECILHYLRKILTFLISRIGLMIIVMGYVMAGGLIIEALESDHEKKSLELSNRVLDGMLQRIYKQIENNSTRVKDFTFYNFLRSEIRSFSDFYTNATLNGTLSGHVDPQWDYFGSVFYCVTLISTIGYGHITCKTKMGKVFTIVYSAIGIPLMMLFLANIGSSTATLFKFIYLRMNQCQRGLRSPRDFFRGTRTEYINEIEYNDYNEQEEIEYIGDGGEYENEQDGVSNKEAFYRDAAIFGGPPSHSATSMVKFENEAVIEDNRRAVKARPEFVTIKIGLRDVEIERDQLDHFLAEFRIQVIPAPTPPAKIPKVEAVKKKGEEIPPPLSLPPPRAQEEFITDEQSIKDQRLVEAIKKMDSLLGTGGDQDSISGAVIKYQVRTAKRRSIRRQDLEFDESLDKTMNSLDESPTTPTPSKNIKFQIHSDGEDEEEDDDGMLVDGGVGDYSNVDFNDDDEPIGNKEYLLTSIFTSQRTAIRINVPKTHPTTTPTQTTPQPIKPLDRQTSEPVVRRADPLSLSVQRLVSDSGAPREVAKSTPTTPTPTRVVKQTEFADQSSSTRMLKTTIKQQQPRQQAQQARTSAATARKLMSVYSVPGFSSDLLKRNQTVSSRSAYSYDYPPSQEDSKRRRRGSKAVPFYNERQLKLIYKQYRQQKRDKTGIPMLWTAIIMPTYLFAGMLIFSSFENWRRLDALYFCFTTLTTIGFGDFIPTRSTLLNKNNGNKNNLYISSFYIFLGLILIAMCINLVKNQLKKKIKAFARKIGLSNC